MEGSQLYQVGGGYKKNLPFRVSIHDPMQIADIIGRGVEIKAGYVSTFVITPSQIVTSENTKYLPKEKRQCQFKNENEGITVFKVVDDRLTH